MRDQQEATRRIERAGIERWFSSDAFGAYFHADDGRAWPIDDATAARGRVSAFAAVDAMLATARRQAFAMIATTVLAAVAVPHVVPTAWQGHVMTAIAGALCVATFVSSLVGTASYRRRLRRLRAEIARAVAGPALDADDPQRHARTNLFRVGQHLWVIGVLVAVAITQLRAGPFFLQTLGGFGTLLAVAVAMGGAWGLYLAAERVDRVQAKPRERLSRIPYATRDSWSQAD